MLDNAFDANAFSWNQGIDLRSSEKRIQRNMCMHHLGQLSKILFFCFSFFLFLALSILGSEGF